MKTLHSLLLSDVTIDRHLVQAVVSGNTPLWWTMSIGGHYRQVYCHTPVVLYLSTK